MEAEPVQRFPGYMYDINSLLGAWAGVSLSVYLFKKIWKALNFSHIHRGGARNVPPEQYVQALYRATLDYLPRIDELPVRVGILYCLYCIYNTQVSDNNTKQKIAQTVSSWKEMLYLYQQIKEHKVADALFIWKRMKEEKVFMFTAAPVRFDNPENTTPNTLPTEVINTDTLTGVVDIGVLQDISNRYSSAKNEASTTIPSLNEQSYRVIDPSFVENIKSLLQQVEQQQYVQQQLQQGPPPFPAVEDDIPM